MARSTSSAPGVEEQDTRNAADLKASQDEKDRLATEESEKRAAEPLDSDDAFASARVAPGRTVSYRPHAGVASVDYGPGQAVPFTKAHRDQIQSMIDAGALVLPPSSDKTPAELHAEQANQDGGASVRSEEGSGAEGARVVR